MRSIRAMVTIDSIDSIDSIDYSFSKSFEGILSNKERGQLYGEVKMLLVCYLCWLSC